MDIKDYILSMCCMMVVNCVMLSDHAHERRLFLHYFPLLDGTKRLKKLIVIFKFLKLLDLIIFTILFFCLRNYIDRKYMALCWGCCLLADPIIYSNIFAIFAIFERKKEAERRNNLDPQS